jgi:hypothetical protein
MYAPMGNKDDEKCVRSSCHTEQKTGTIRTGRLASREGAGETSRTVSEEGAPAARPRLRAGVAAPMKKTQAFSLSAFLHASLLNNMHLCTQFFFYLLPLARLCSGKKGAKRGGNHNSPSRSLPTKINQKYD